MDQKRKIKEEIAANQILEMLTETYQEHAIEQINFARSSVLSSRDFTEQLAEVFYNVKAQHERYLAALTQKEGQKKKIKNGKQALVLLTANNKLYGDIVLKVNELFYKRALESNADLVVMGRLGKEYLDQHHLNKPYKYFEIPDSNFTIEILASAIEHILPYERVVVFHGKFENILTQEAVEIDVTGDLPLKKPQTKDEQENFLFEPSIEEVLHFFETQILSMLFNQATHEGSLARFGSRVKAMELAQDSIGKQLKNLTRKQNRLKEMELNKKQIQLMAGKSLWRKR